MTCPAKDAEERPQLASGDLRYLRKRRLAMEELFEDAQEDELPMAS